MRVIKLGRDDNKAVAGMRFLVVINDSQESKAFSPLTVYARPAQPCQSAMLDQQHRLVLVTDVRASSKLKKSRSDWFWVILPINGWARDRLLDKLCNSSVSR